MTSVVLLSLYHRRRRHCLFCVHLFFHLFFQMFFPNVLVPSVIFFLGSKLVTERRIPECVYYVCTQRIVMVIPLDVSGKEVRQPEHQQVDPAILPPSSLLVSQVLSYLSRHWRNFVSSLFSFDSHFRQLFGGRIRFPFPLLPSRGIHTDVPTCRQNRTETKNSMWCSVLVCS